jgi:hypothetical protein
VDEDDDYSPIPAFRWYGRRFLEYVLNVEDIVSNIAQVEDSRADTLNMLDSCTPPGYFDEHGNREALRIALLSPAAGDDVGLATKLRESCGEAVPLPDADDAVTRELLALVRDYYPLTLMSPTTGPHAPYSFTGGTAQSNSLHSHPSVDRLIIALANDSAFAEFGVPYGDTHLYNRTEQLRTIWGFGGSVRLSDIPGNLLNYTLMLGQVRGASNLSAYIAIAVEAVAAARRLLIGDRVELPVLIGLSGIRFEAGQPDFSIAQGIIRNAPRSKQSLFLRGAYGAPPSAFLELSEEDGLASRIGQGSADFPLDNDGLQALHRNLDTTIRYCLYAFVLASTEDGTLRPTYHSTVRLNPLMPAQRTGTIGASAAAGRQLSISTQISSTVSEISRVVAERHIPSLNIAMRRLTAAASRNDPSDAFIDTIMCWENLFGGTPETTFKVCAAMSILLEPSDSKARNSLFVRLKKIYGKRSLLVHGAQELDPATAYDLQIEALLITVRSLNAVYRNQTLLTFGNSNLRCNYTILGDSTS